MNALQKTLTGIFATAVIAAAIPASADGRHKMRGHAMMPSFEELDANGDGSISAEEAQAYVDSLFAAQDADGDGMISPEEFKSAIMAKSAEMMEKHSDRMISKLDDNDDGMLSKDEVIPASLFQKMFERLDTDDDGAISKEEFESMKSKRGRDGKGHRKGKRGDSRDDGHHGDRKMESESN